MDAEQFLSGLGEETAKKLPGLERIMEYFTIICQLIAALGILNVWLLRPKKATAYRGGTAKNMKEEFAVYGLPGWFMVLIGSLKVLFALMLLVGIGVPALVTPAAYGLAALMVGAVAMHIKVKDPLKKTLPALSVLALSLFVAIS